MRPGAWLQPAVLTGTLLPFGVLAYRAAGGHLGANPVATALNQLERLHEQLRSEGRQQAPEQGHEGGVAR